jgi:hypothetical protein
MIARSIHTGQYLGEVMVEVRKLERGWKLRHPEEHKALVELRALDRQRIQSREDEVVERLAPQLSVIDLWKIWVATVKRLRLSVELSGDDQARDQLALVLAGGRRIQDRVREMMKEKYPAEYERDYGGAANG